jgi:tRNA A-37 threonylcarbamoyl transferase component Bud32
MRAVDLRDAQGMNESVQNTQKQEILTPADHIDQVDLVCGRHILFEKRKGFKRSADDDNFEVIGLFVKNILLLVLVLVSTLIFFSGLSAILAWAYDNPDWRDQPGLYCLIFFFIAEMISLLVLLEFRHGQKPFPTNIIVTPAGVSFAWRFKGNTQSECIPWTIIKDVHTTSRTGDVSAPGRQEIILRLEIDKKQLSTSQTLLIWKQTHALSHNLRVPRNWDKLYVNFPLDSLSLDADKFRLLSAVREMAPKAVLAPDFDEVFTSDKAPTYTELWLDDMQTFRRHSVHELPGETTLNEGRYKIIDKIATGGQAKIYRAIDTKTDTQVALKELVLPVNAGAEVRNRSFANVKKEALLLAGLDHQGILKLLDNFVEDHRAYLVFEYIDGRTLRLMVQEDGPLEAGLAISTAIAICDILAYLHGQIPPVVHRDLAPDNLMMTAAGKIVLLDFNFAQQLESNTTRTVVGKHNYMAPEQFKGKPCPQSDLYSLGGTVFYLVTGRDPTPLSCSRPSTVLRCLPLWTIL